MSEVYRYCGLVSPRNETAYGLFIPAARANSFVPLMIRAALSSVYYVGQRGGRPEYDDLN